MPITDEYLKFIPLQNEITGKDFDSISCNWLYASFTSGYVYPPLQPALSGEVANFLNEQARGPYYVHETHAQGHSQQGKIMHMVLLHPDDRAEFAQRFDPAFWKAEPKSAEKNAGVLGLQIARGFQYENPAMARLQTELAALVLPTELQAADVDAVARRIWVRPQLPGAPTTANRKRLAL